VQPEYKEPNNIFRSRRARHLTGKGNRSEKGKNAVEESWKGGSEEIEALGALARKKIGKLENQNRGLELSGEGCR